MKENEAFVLQAIGLSEGGYVNNEKDPGGPTDRGITQRTFDAYNDRTGQPRRPVKGISKELADAIIAEGYLRPIRFNDLPAGLDYAVADFAVNSGVKRAVVELQFALDMPADQIDGAIGDKTLAAIRNYLQVSSAPVLIEAYCERRMSYLKGLKTFKTFGDGWTTRVEGKRIGVQEDDIGVVDRAIKIARASGRGETISTAAVPLPRVAASGKAIDVSRATTTIVGKVLADPAILIPAVGTIAAPAIGGSGPISWALAGVILLGALYALTRALKRQA